MYIVPYLYMHIYIKNIYVIYEYMFVLEKIMLIE